MCRIIKRKGIVCAAAILLIIVYFARFAWVNRDNGKSSFVHYTDEDVVSCDGVDISLVEQNLYDIPAFTRRYPDTQEMYSFGGYHFTMAGMPYAYESLKYILEVRLRFTNRTKESRTVDLTEYQLLNVNQTIYQGVYPELVKLLNGDVSCMIAPGEQQEAVLCYDIIGMTMHHPTYQRLKKEPMMISLSKYPYPKAITLNHLRHVRGEAKEAARGEDVPSGDVVLQRENTPSGSILDYGEEQICQNVGIHVEDVTTVQNANDYEGYSLDGWMEYFAREFLNKDGTVRTIEEKDHGLPKKFYKKGYENYIIFVKLRLHNYSSSENSIFLDCDLVNNDNTLATVGSAEYMTARNLKEEKYISDISMGPGEDLEVTMGYARSICNDFDLDREPLYITNSLDSDTEMDLEHGKGGYGVYLKLQ